MSRPARPAPLLALVLATLLLAAVIAQVPTTLGAWIATTVNPGNSFATGQWIADPGSQTFAYTGTVEAFEVPMGYTQVTIEAEGAQGGTRGSEAGGLGGEAVAVVPVSAGETLHVYVGGQPSGRTGGFNGGGSGGSGGVGFSPGDGGGGASDVRRGGTSLSHRVIVGGGGGGASANSGGAGGGLTGGPGGGSNGGSGGDQSGGGSGNLGIGGDGVSGGLLGLLTCGGGGGGGGYYGGEGAGRCGGGGGGSAFVDAAGNTNTGTTPGVRDGHGQVTITWGQ